MNIAWSAVARTIAHRGTLLHSPQAGHSGTRRARSGRVMPLPLPDSRSDEDYVALVAQGEEEALRVLHQRYAGLVFSLALHKLGPGPAEELVQDVFLTLWRKAASFDPARGAFRHWFLRVAHRQIIDQWRAAQAHGGRHAAVGDMDLLLGRVASREPAPEERATRAEQDRATARALLALPDAQRQVLLLGYFDGLSQAAMARHLGVPLGTVKKRVHLGLAKLRTLLGHEGEAR